MASHTTTLADCARMRRKPASLVGQAALCTAVLFALSMLAVAWLACHQIEAGALNDTAAFTAVYLNSMAAGVLGSARDTELHPAQAERLEVLLDRSSLAARVLNVRVWAIHGDRPRLASAPSEDRPVDTSKLAEASRGLPLADLSRRGAEEWLAFSPAARLLDVYAPVRQPSADAPVLGVVELHQSAEAVLEQAASDQAQAWLTIGLGTLGLYLLLLIMMYRAYLVLARRDQALNGSARHLTDRCAGLFSAGAAAATLEELRRDRIAADIRMRPLSALLSATAALERAAGACRCGCLNEQDMHTTRTALDEAARVLDAIASKCQLVDVAPLQPVEILRMLVSNHAARTGSVVMLLLGDLPETLPVAAKIALFRVAEAELAAIHQHLEDARVQVSTRIEGGSFVVRIHESTAGLVTVTDGERSDGAFLLDLWAEQVELMGGRLSLESAPCGETEISLHLPLGDALRERLSTLSVATESAPNRAWTKVRPVIALGHLRASRMMRRSGL